MCTSVCFKSAIISVLIARSHSDDNHVNATAPCMSCTQNPYIAMHFAQARPPMSCIPLVTAMATVLELALFPYEPGNEDNHQARILALQYNALKTHQFLPGTVSAFHCTHSPTYNGIQPITLSHQNINIKLHMKIRAGNLKMRHHMRAYSVLEVHCTDSCHMMSQ